MFLISAIIVLVSFSIGLVSERVISAITDTASGFFERRNHESALSDQQESAGQNP
jgi:hypothetical protein